MSVVIFVIVGFLVLFGVIWGVAYYGAMDRWKMDQALSKVAENWNGTYDNKAYDEKPSATSVLTERTKKFPKIVMPHKGYTMSLEYTTTKGRDPTSLTHLCLHLTEAKSFPIRILVEGMFSGLAKSLGWQDIQIGQEDFDNTFHIKGDDETRVRAFLEQPVREAIEEIYQLQGNKTFGLEKKGEILKIEKISWLKNESQLNDFIQWGKAIFDSYLNAAGLLNLGNDDQ